MALLELCHGTAIFPQADQTMEWATPCVKAKMCETTPFVNTVGAHYVASRAHIEQACDSLRSQGQSITTVHILVSPRVMSIR